MANLTQIEKYLQEKGIKYRVVDLGRGPSADSGQGVFKVEDVIKVRVNPDEIVKTLIVRTDKDFVALAVRGKDRVDFKKVRRLFGNKSELARAGEVERVAGVPVGAVCPILLDTPLYFDQKVMDLKYINMGSGDLTRGLEMDFKDLLAAVGDYQVEDLAL